MLNSLIKNVVLAAALVAPGVAAAQTQEQFREAFSGGWLVFDNRFSTGGAPCSVQLDTELSLRGVADESQLRPSATTQSCAAPLDTVASWDIEQSQLALYDTDGQLIARLGGNQTRVTGGLENGFASLILERQSGEPYQAAINQAVSRHRCIYLGYTSDCASSDDLGVPDISAEAGAAAPVEILVNLNVRDQPRRNAGVIGTLQPQACLQVNYCTTASDGVWCRAQFGEISGWVSKTTLRQDEWPVATFVNGCTTQ